MAGIVAYGAYIPYHRLDKSRISEALGTPPARGTRAVASYDEDTTSMAVEAARGLGAGSPSQVLFATTAPAYLDKTNATAIHAALGLDASAPAFDMAGSVRSGIGALRAALAQPNTLAVLSDIRTGLPSSADEANGGDGAVAFLTGDTDTIADVVAVGSSTAEFLDRWRLPTDTTSRQWEERFGEHLYVPLAEAALTDALKQAGLTADDVDHLVVAGTHARAAKRFGADELGALIGNCGAAHPGLVLADALDRAQPGQHVVLLTLADGADAIVFKVNKAGNARTRTVRQQIEQGSPSSLPYATFLTWRGQLHREPPRRPDPERPAAPPSARREDWKFGFAGSRCDACGTRHLPPQRVCVHCHAVDQMSPERLADVPGAIATFTVDRLAFSLSPPVVAAVVDFDGGGRFQCELTDVDPAAVKIGDRVEMTFRRLFTADGVHNYFWKARPLRGGSQ